MTLRFVLGLLLSFTAFAQADLPYEPMTSAERWKKYTKDNFTGPGVYLSAFGPPIRSHLNNEPTEWEKGFPGYMHHVAYSYTRSLIDSSIRHSTAAALGHDVRYERSNKKGVLPRVGHALSRTFVTRNSEGRLVPYVSNFMGSYGGAMLGTYMLSDRHEPLNYGVQRGHIRLAGKSFGNLFREFSPEIKRLFRIKR